MTCSFCWQDNVFDTGSPEEKVLSSEMAACSQASLSLLSGSPEVPPDAEEDESDWKERHSSHNEGSVDSMEEMARRFEKVGDILRPSSLSLWCGHAKDGCF